MITNKRVEGNKVIVTYNGLTVTLNVPIENVHRVTTNDVLDALRLLPNDGPSKYPNFVNK